MRIERHGGIYEVTEGSNGYKKVKVVKGQGGNFIGRIFVERDLNKDWKDAPAPAHNVPTPETADVDDSEGSKESNKRVARRRGKGGLVTKRVQGSGINI